jgi:hypothetical protein
MNLPWSACRAALIVLACSTAASPQQLPSPPAPPSGIATGESRLSVRVPREQFAELRFSNRHLITFRAAVVPRDPAERAENAERALSRLADNNVTGPVSARPFMGASVISVAGSDVFGILPDDVDEGTEDLETLTRDVVARVQVALAEAAESRTPERLLRGALAALLATALLGVGILRLGDADEGGRRRLGDTDFEILDPHPRIDEDRHRPDLEEGKGQRKEFRARRDHEDSAHPTADAERFQSVGDAVALDFKLAKGGPGVAGGTVRVMADRTEERRGLGLEPRHLRQVGGDIGEMVKGSVH